MSVDRLLNVGLLLMLLFSGVATALPDIQQWTTSRGSRVFHVATDGLPLVDLRVVFDAGSTRDGAQFGLASLTSTLLDTGAGDWDADAIAKRLENVGAALGTGVSRDSAYVSLRSLSDKDKLSVAVDTLREILARPLFAQADFDREKQRVLLGIRQRGEDPGDIAEIAFFKALYGDHPYGHPQDGLTETLQPLAPEDLRNFHKRYYTARNALVVITGDIQKTDAAAIAEKLLADLPEGSAPAPIAEPKAPVAAQTLKMPFPSAQTHLLAGTLGIKVNDPDLFPLYVGNHILGGSGLVSRISEEVREKRGLSYSASSYFYPFREAGPFQLGLQTRNDKAEEALKVSLDTLRRFISEGPTAAELDAAKKNIVGGFVMRLDSNQKLTGEVASIAFFNRPPDYLATFTQKVQAVTREDVQRAFQARLNPDKLQTVLVGGGAQAK